MAVRADDCDSGPLSDYQGKADQDRTTVESSVDFGKLQKAARHVSEPSKRTDGAALRPSRRGRPRPRLCLASAPGVTLHTASGRDAGS